MILLASSGWTLEIKMIKQGVRMLAKLTRIGQYIKDLKKENASLRKLIIEKDNKIAELNQEILETNEDYDDNLDFMQKIIYLCVKDAYGTLGINVTDEMVEQYIDELSERVETTPSIELGSLCDAEV